MSLVDSRTAAYWPIDEQADSVLPREASGQLDDLTVPGGITRPAVVTGTPSGFGRDITRSPAAGFIVTDTDGDLRLVRNVTLIWVARLDIASLADGNICTLIQRGRGGGSDPISFGLRVVVVELATRLCRLEMFWQTAAGTNVVDAGAVFVWPLNAFCLLAATRERIDDFLGVRYQLNAQSAEGEQDHTLDVGGAVSADVSIGMGMAAAAYQDHWDGTLDQGHVLDEAVCPEEFEFLWQQATIDQPGGVATVRGLLPPDVYSTDPDSNIQRELAVEGMALGYAKSLARRLRFFFLPDKAFGEVLAHWERLLGISPKPGESIAKRRARILGITNTARGYAVEDVQFELAEAFGLDAADVDILEFDNVESLDFASAPATGTIPIQGNGDAWAVASGVLQARQTGGVDLRYGGIGTPRAMQWLRTLSSGLEATVAAKIDIVSTTSDALGGLLLGRRDTDDWVWIGTSEVVDGTVTLNWLKYKDGVLDSAVTQLATGVSDPLWVRATMLDDGTIDVRWGSSEANAKAAAPTNIAPGIGTPEWAGLGVVAPGSDASVNGSYDFDDFWTFTPNGDQRFCWFAYRDPGDPGVYDLERARLIIARVKPAHTTASATTALVAIAGDVVNPCGTTPTG